MARLGCPILGSPFPKIRRIIAPANGPVLYSCHYPQFDAFLARGCGRQHKAWGGALAEPQEYGVNTHQACEAGGSFLLFAIEIEPMAVARIRGLAR